MRARARGDPETVANHLVAWARAFILFHDKQHPGTLGLGTVVRERCAGWRAWVFTGNERLAREIGMVAIDEAALFNGKIPCRFLRLQ